MYENVTTAEANAIVWEGLKRDGNRIFVILDLGVRALSCGFVWYVVICAFAWIVAGCLCALTGSPGVALLQQAARNRLSNPRSLFSNMGRDALLVCVPAIVASEVLDFGKYAALFVLSVHPLEFVSWMLVLFMHWGDVSGVQWIWPLWLARVMWLMYAGPQLGLLLGLLTFSTYILNRVLV